MTRIREEEEDHNNTKKT